MSTNQKKTRPFGMRDKLGYMMGDIGCNLTKYLIDTYMLVFYVTIIGIKPAHYSVIIVALKIFDAINDPIIGNYCDRRKVKKDRFLSWVKAFCIPLAVFSTLFFVYVPNLPYWIYVVQFALVYLCWSLLYTATNIPYGAAAAVISNIPADRTELSRYRSIGSVFAQMALAIVAPLVVYDANSNPVASRFLMIAGIAALFGAITLLLTSNLCTERIHIENAATKKMNFFTTLKEIVKNRPMVFCILSYMVLKLFVQTSSVAAQYTFMYYYNNTTYLSLTSLFGLVGMFIGAVATKPLAKKYGKQFLCSFPMLISGIIYLLMGLLPITALTWTILSFFTATFISGYSMVIWAVITDCIDYQELMTGERMDGTIYSFYNFLVKLVGSFGSALVLGVLVFVGYDASLGADQLPQVCTNIKMASAFMPAFGLIVIFFLMKFGYNIDKKTEESMYKQLEERRKENA